MHFIVVIIVVARGQADHVVEEAKKAGALGATILFGRGTGEKEFRKFFDLHIESSKEVIFILTEEEKSRPIVKAVVEAGRLNDPGTGILFTMPVIDVIGLHHREPL
ncbi:MAG TPA: P-II family nitrogen regulator [Candidatus Bipolaricaulis anaerobius]|jgi:nitrogen regulatory protein PII|nr:P-II family nitrogen regulator [Candidatus Bipolaricaulis sp.]MDD2911979.1 P-II family nitrogen regulator [Candidatus Bipolaricaulis anaerobius]MDD3748332.1 P-II family nitrogen regulator [Candidatus Bipolaricaulis anaerobius]MDD5763830.1 P-II family nitrogen regulator [Candidatus Bipolaricaulis anaerobius]HNR24850.1 P-II family nitrogen regulator [Candidatus Bipolaricaulis anaerobius]